MDRTLIDISQDIFRLNDLLDELEGDITDQETVIDGWLDRLGTERDRKLDNYAALITELEARAEFRKAEARRLQERARIDQNRADFLKERLKRFFVAHGLKTVDAFRYRITLAMNGGKLPLRVLVDPEELPELFRRERTVVEADTDTIRVWLENDLDVEDEDGRALAVLGERGSSIRIR